MGYSIKYLSLGELWEGKRDRRNKVMLKVIRLREGGIAEERDTRKGQAGL